MVDMSDTNICPKCGRYTPHHPEDLQSEDICWRTDDSICRAHQRTLARGIKQGVEKAKQYTYMKDIIDEGLDTDDENLATWRR